MIQRRTLRKRFITRELQEKRKSQARIKAMRQSNLRKAKAKRQKELKKKRDELTLKQYLQKCEPEFRYIVSQWAKDKTLAKVLRFFRLLEEHKCPMEPCYTPNKWCKVLNCPEILRSHQHSKNRQRLFG